jgi:hypothetical protein
MRHLLLSTALCIAAPICVATAASAQQTVTFLCAAPAGHVCQFAVQTGGSQMAFALPSGERKEVPGITPHSDKYCVCDPGPITSDCKAHSWTIGAWALGSTLTQGSLRERPWNERVHRTKRSIGGLTRGGPSNRMAPARAMRPIWTAPSFAESVGRRSVRGTLCRVARR